jgi:hypothetical protein
MEVEVDGGVGYPSGVDSGLWMPFAEPRGVGRNGSSNKLHPPSQLW